MERVDYNNAIFTCFEGDISVSVWRTALYSPAEAHSAPSQVSKTDLSTITV